MKKKFNFKMGDVKAYLFATENNPAENPVSTDDAGERGVD